MCESTHTDGSSDSATHTHTLLVFVQPAFFSLRCSRHCPLGDTGRASGL